MLSGGLLIEFSGPLIWGSSGKLVIFLLLVIYTLPKRLLFYSIYLLLFFATTKFRFNSTSTLNAIVVGIVGIVISVVMVALLYRTGLQNMWRIYEFDEYNNILYYLIVCYKWEPNIVAAPLLSVIVSMIYLYRTRNKNNRLAAAKMNN
jgi:hypothetical protein